MILDDIVKKRKERIKMSNQRLSLDTLKDMISKIPIHYDFPFEKVLQQKGMSFIMEVKKASPSKGIIVDEFDYLKIAKEYQQIGASAISVLTEPDYFQGDNRYLRDIAMLLDILVLRKDFIIDEYMIYESKLLGASAILLICSILDIQTLKKYFDLANQLGMSVLVETHNESEIQNAIDIGARIIGVNNRDLKTFEVNIHNSIKLRKHVPQDILFISESGMKTYHDIQSLYEHQVDAVLIGETMMTSKDKQKTFNQLRGLL